MSGVTERNTTQEASGEIVPWASGNPLRDILERKKRKRLELVKLLVQRESEAARALPKEAREFIKIPDIKVLLDDI